MTENELHRVPINGFYQFTLYYGEKVFGSPLKQGDQWYIITRTWDGDYKVKITPEEIDYMNILTTDTNTVYANRRLLQLMVGTILKRL